METVAEVRLTSSTSATVNAGSIGTPTPFSRYVIVDPEVSVGASFTFESITVSVTGADDSSPSDAVTVKVLEPFSFAAGT